MVFLFVILYYFLIFFCLHDHTVDNINLFSTYNKYYEHISLCQLVFKWIWKNVTLNDISIDF